VGKFDPDLALAQARALDHEQRGGPRHGVPIRVKDIIDTFDMPTEMGLPIYRGYRPATDAARVALLRRAGAIILGKTATCELAGMAPSATTNPHNAAHTPGSSSSCGPRFCQRHGNVSNRAGRNRFEDADP
jgi:Asp-tRNA(Asn)/Glu-tRNA(Gln) amidotransferase A subunit family amidase